MDCEEVRPHLADRLDDLLDPEQAQQVGEHVQACPACAQASQQLAVLRTALYQPLPVAAPSPDLRARILARAAVQPRRHLPIWLRYAATFAAGVLAALAWTDAVPQAATQEFTQQPPAPSAPTERPLTPSLALRRIR